MHEVIVWGITPDAVRDRLAVLKAEADGAMLAWYATLPIDEADPASLLNEEHAFTHARQAADDHLAALQEWLS